LILKFDIPMFPWDIDIKLLVHLRKTCMETGHIEGIYKLGTSIVAQYLLHRQEIIGAILQRVKNKEITNI
jgi:hypothetical protein